MIDLAAFRDWQSVPKAQGSTWKLRDYTNDDKHFMAEQVKISVYMSLREVVPHTQHGSKYQWTPGTR